ncbi:MAG TPA: MFS transporter, partial [Caulobacteraceae bacterium]|nr:MFS transporter [Caulobacteraceae bacterium]
MTDRTASAADFQGFGTSAYRSYVLAVLFIVYTFNFIDRTVLTIVQEPIRHEFGLSDTQLGLLGGPTFAFFYTFLGIPIARFAERRNRMTILSVCLALWSGMTALCGAASSFTMLLLARVGVGVGEAGCTPTANSVIGDYFAPEKRSTAVAIYSMGVPIGASIAAIGGGFLAEHLNWRESFLVLGLPGLALAILAKLTVREPPRSTPDTEATGVLEAFGALARKPTFWNIALGGAMASFTGYGVGQFTNSFFIRSHHLSILDASLISGVLVGIFGGGGTFLAGWMSDKVVGRHPNALAWFPGLTLLISIPLSIGGYLAHSLLLAVPLLALATLFQYPYVSAIYAATQAVVHPRMRATAVAVLLFIVNIIGLGAGPPAIGALSDFLAGHHLAAAGLS